MSLRIQSKQITPPVNLLSSPEDLTASPWGTRLTPLSNTELAPDGTYTASKFAYLLTYATLFQAPPTVVLGETYTISVYAKGAGPVLLYDHIGLAITAYGAYANFGLDGTGYIFPQSTNCMNMSIEPAANGFYHIAYTFTATQAYDIAFWLGGYNGENYTGNTITMWGAQLVHRPNLIPAQYVNNYTDASWSKANITVTPDDTIAPDGTLTADKLTATNGDPYIERWTTEVKAGVTYLASVYVKAGSANSVGARGFIWTWFRPDIPGRADGPNNYGEVLHTLTTEWQQTYVTFTPYTSGLVSFRVDTMEVNWTYAPGDYTYMWGASLTVADDIPYYPQRQLNSGVRIQSRQLLGYVDRGLQFYIDAANTASNLTTAIADISSNHYSVGVHNATITPTAFQVRNFYGQTSTQCIVTAFDNGILKSTNKPGTWTLEAHWKNISPPCSNEAFIVGRIGWHGGIYCYSPDGTNTEIHHAIKTNSGWTGAYDEPIVSVAPGETVHSVMTYNDGWIRSYINGILIKTHQWDYNTYGMTNYDNNIRIGGWDYDPFPQYGTNSDIYAIRCYDTELTQQEIAQNYQHIIQQSRANYGFRIQT